MESFTWGLQGFISSRHLMLLIKFSTRYNSQITLLRYIGQHRWLTLEYMPATTSRGCLLSSFAVVTSLPVALGTPVLSATTVHELQGARDSFTPGESVAVGMWRRSPCASTSQSQIHQIQCPDPFHQPPQLPFETPRRPIEGAGNLAY